MAVQYGKLVCYCTPETEAEFKALAASRDVSVSKLLRKLIDDELAREARRGVA